MKKILCFLLVLCFSSAYFCFNEKVEKASCENFCKASVVIEKNSHRVLSEFNKDERLANASTTKIMTALVTLENCNNLDEIVDVDDRSVGIEGTSIYLKKGEKLTVKELLFGLMLASGNDASLALAYHIGKGNLKNFVELMNEKAKSLGLENTHFDNPHGLDSQTHYTSAYDLAIIASEAMKNSDFREIVSTKIKQISGNDECKNRFLRNKQRLIGFLDGCNGIKSGFTDNAGRCLVTSCKRGDFEVICVVLNCPDMFNYSANLVNNAYDSYNLETILEPYFYVDDLSVENGDKESVKLFSMKGLKYPLKENEKALIYIEKEIPEKLTAPLKKEEIVGKIKIFFEKDLIFSENIYTMESVENVDIKEKVKNIIDKWFYD